MDSIRVARVSPVVLDRLELRDPALPPTKQRVHGDLHLTPHHLIFIPSPSGPGPSAAARDPPAEVWIPYPTITRLQRLPQALDGLYPLQIGTKTFDDYTLWFQRDREGGAEDVWQSVKSCAVASNIDQLYAFFYTLPTASSGSVQAGPSPATPSGWSAYNPRAEFARQGVGSRTKAWRFTDINREYAFCPTYPAKLVVPSRISDSVLAHAAKYRSKARIPALTYLHRTNHASITRSSQPMVGLKNARSPQDERLIDCIFTTHQFLDTAYAPTASSSPSSSQASLPHIYGATSANLIIDARPTTNAVANVAKGAGTENMEWYKSGKKAYLGIENIHVMRASLRTIVDAAREADAAGLPLDREKLRRSGWLKHVSAILDGAHMIVRNVHVYSSHVLIHCSDGWDRTSQLSAVAQLCLDPYYRTIDGFKVLVEKDWLSFGHMFNHRSGHMSSDKLFRATPDNINGDDESDDEFTGAVKGAQALFGLVSKQFTSNAHLKETSPVFHQFLDCVWQILRQFPTRFEFNEAFLLSLHHHLYACQFGTFLFDSERERRTAVDGARPYDERTVSAWDWYDLPEQRARFTNEAYDAARDAATGADADQGVLLFDPKDVRFWARLFHRGDGEMNASHVLEQARGVDVVGPVKAGQTDLVSARGLVRAPSPSPSPAFAARSEPARNDTFRPFGSTSSAFSMHTQAGDRATPGAGAPSPFAKLRGSLPTGAPQWNWSQLSSGAMSAISQIKTLSADAIGQLRAEADETAWGDAREQEPSARVEANPWTEATAKDSFPSTSLMPSSRTAPATAPRPLAPRQPSATANPWSDPTDARPSLADLSLTDPPRGEHTGGARPAGTDEVEDDDAMVRAAMGGDQKAWDPLGAL
ncbi:phosphatidylinositol-3-phosphatase ymr1 [Cryptotrichosporon argae]